MDLSALSRLAYEPPIDPAAWLASQPHVEFILGELRLTLIQPSSSLIVYALGILTIMMGVRLLGLARSDGGGEARRGGSGAGVTHAALAAPASESLALWGLALVVWGIGTLLAGTSYQAFGYMIKGAGRDSLAWTSWWEVLYMILTVASVSVMAFAVSAVSARGMARIVMRTWACLVFVAYLAFALIGASLPDRFMVSFSAMVLFVIPSMLAFFTVNIIAWLRTRRRPDLLLIVAWLAMALIMAAYFGAYLGGLGPFLWAGGIWFTENDVLHIGLIVWMLFLGYRLGPALRSMRDEEE